MKTLRVGITGGIGSGKTLISNIFSHLGIPVFFSDPEAARIMATDKNIIRKISATFGKTVFDTYGQIDRKKFASVVFNDKEKLKDLNSIIHPAVRLLFNRWVQRQQEVPFVIQESAILFETGLYKKLDFTILITAPEKIRIARVMKRDRITKKQVLKRMENQWTDPIKLKMADTVITNDEKKMILPQVLKIHQELFSRK